ncbi:MAG: metal-dependent hydrolase [Halorientalis sp.]
MHRSGHLGVALLVYAPLGAVLLLAGRTEAAVLGEVGMVALAMAPDYDTRVPFVKHRGVTHTVWFALVMGAGLGGVGWLLSGRPPVPPASALVLFGFLVGTLAGLAHLLADALTPMGVRPLWPLSGRTYTLALSRASNPLANYALFAVGVLATGLVMLALGRLP